MPTCMDARMHDWFETPLGQSLLTQEREQCRALLPSGYYPSRLQVGQPSVNFLARITPSVGDEGGEDGEGGARCFFIGERVPTRTTARSKKSEKRTAEGVLHCAIARASAMPFSNKTHNLVLLPHTLDLCAEPHAVLREVNHILVARGCVVIIGFNRFSLWRIWRFWQFWRLKTRHRTHYHQLGKVQDWLSLLGFELVGAKMLGYQPPLRSEKWQRRLRFVEHAGARWLPGLGAVYILVARKEEIATRARPQPALARAPWRRLVMPGIAQPTSSVPVHTARVNPPAEITPAHDCDVR